MKKKGFITSVLSIVLVLVLALTPMALACPPKHDGADAMEFVKQFKVGINLGNSLTAFNYDDNGEMGLGDLNNETCWGCPRVTQEQMNAFAAAGMQIIRIGVTWGPHMGSAPDYKINPEWMARVKEVVDYAINAGMYVILNTMSEEVYWYSPTKRGYYESSYIQSKVWSQIGQAFADYDEHLLFEANNEPRNYGSYMEWKGGVYSEREALNKLNADFVKTVRALGGNNAERYLLIPTYAASGANKSALRDMRVPDDSRVIVSIHNYYENGFCNDTNPDKAEWGSKRDKKLTEKYMYVIDKFFTSRGIPVMFTEFGCVDKNNDGERAEWIEYNMKEAAKYGMPCLWWDNGIPHYQYEYGGAFGIMDRETCEITHPEVVKALNCLK